MVHHARPVSGKYEEHYNNHASLTWIFHFVDIIYVGAVYSIGQLFEKCGNDYKVYFMAAAYLGIMFTTRYQFDQYAGTFAIKKSEANGVEFSRVVLMLIYCMSIYSMTLNIAFDETDDSSTLKGHFGTCVRNKVYDNFFAGSFLLSRIAIVFMYSLKLLSDKYKDKQRDDLKILILRKLLPLLLSIITMCVIFADVSPVVVYSVVAVVEFLSEFIGEAKTSLKQHSEAAPLMPDPVHLQERLGLFFMLILGETMVGTLFTVYKTDKIRRTYGFCMAAFVLVVAIGMQFFERAQSEVNAPENFYGDRFNEYDHPHRLSIDVPPAPSSRSNSNASHVSALHSAHSLGPATATFDVESPNVSRQAPSELQDVPMMMSVDREKKWNHHPLCHKKKRYYAAYVALHAIIAFFMLITTTAIVEMYYNIEQFHPDTADDGDDAHASVDDGHSGGHQLTTDAYKLLKAQATGGLVFVWLCMLLMELLQPEYFTELFAHPSNSHIIDRNYSKIMFLLKFVVMIGHCLVFVFQSHDPDRANYFVFLNAVVASTPSLLDFGKIVHDYAYGLAGMRKKKREEARRQSAAADAAAAPVGTNTDVLSLEADTSMTSVDI